MSLRLLAAYWLLAAGFARSLATPTVVRFVWRRSLARTMWDGLLQSLDFGGKTMMPIRYAVGQLMLWEDSHHDGHEGKIY